jgi:hypothetical protein
MEDLVKKYGTTRDIKGLPSSTLTAPAVIFKERLPKKKVVVYDSSKVLALFDSATALYELIGTSGSIIRFA